MNIDSPHHFACYYAALSSLLQKNMVGHRIQFDDPTLAHRIYTILRMQADDTVTIFDRTHKIVLALHSQPNKKSMAGTVLQQEKHAALSPDITVWLPLLKREALQDAIYNSVELGANIIQLLITAKVHAVRYDNTMAQRLEAVAIAAAEQSKQFMVPTIVPPKLLSLVIQELPENVIKLCFHPDGQHLSSITPHLTPSRPIIITVGPEGDFTQAEKLMLEDTRFQFYRLTPTILRSQQAMSLALGVVRSMVR